MTTQGQKLYSITIFGYKKAGMTEKEYRDYISITHAGHLKALLAKNGIVSYTMQHNTTDVNMPLLEKIYGGHLPTGNISNCDALIQIVFEDIQDYLSVREDPHFISVVNPDHLNFSDPQKTRFAMGFFEVHVTDGKVVS